MFKTIFRKQFAAYVCALIIGFGILGIVLSNLFRGYFISVKTDELMKQCQLAEQSVLSFYFDVFNTPRELRSNLDNLIKDLSTVHNYTGSSFFIVENLEITQNIDHIWRSFNGITAYTKTFDEDSINNVLQSGLLSQVLEGEWQVMQGNLNGLFNENMLVVGHPILYGEQVIAAIFMNTPLADIEQKVQEFIRLTVICLLISAVISFVFVYFSSKTISKPIHKISEAAKFIADGNFERRIDVNSSDEIGLLAESFNNMAESLNNQEIHRREFIGNISHDLRSPLTSMKGFLRAILDGTVPEEKRNKYLDIVLSETERLSKLANDILDISKIQNMDVELDLSEFDINELIRQTVVSLETKISSKELEVNIPVSDEKIIVFADRDKIQRVIYNLVDNAVKFTGNNGIISVEAVVLQNEKKVKISVKDSGIGISPNEQKRIFERFYKADMSRGEDKKGSGLGLSIVREFIKAHGESIDIMSEIDKGCQFTFMLPHVG